MAATQINYTLPVEQTKWFVPGGAETAFAWDYDDMRGSLLALYDKGKRQQWDASDRIDWSQDLDPENPMQLPDESLLIFGTPMWDRMTVAERRRFRHHAQAWQISQFLHGEQGALICTAKIVQTVPDIDSKFYAATQVADEARHVEAYSRLLREKFELAYPINPHLKTLLDQAISDRRWDFTYLAMQILIEGLALAAFQRIRDYSQNPLSAAINAYVMQDEARHVAFGRLALRDYYPHLTQKERDEREEFVQEACWLMRDRFTGFEILEHLDLPVDEIREHAEHSEAMRLFRTFLFSRIVPTVRDIGLWGPRVQKTYTDMGVIMFSQIDSAEMLAQDQKVAEEFDAEKRLRDLEKAIAQGEAD